MLWQPTRFGWKLFETLPIFLQYGTTSKYFLTISHYLHVSTIYFFNFTQNLSPNFWTFVVRSDLGATWSFFYLGTVPFDPRSVMGPSTVNGPVEAILCHKYRVLVRQTRFNQTYFNNRRNIVMKELAGLKTLICCGLVGVVRQTAIISTSSLNKKLISFSLGIRRSD